MLDFEVLSHSSYEHDKKAYAILDVWTYRKGIRNEVIIKKVGVINLLKKHEQELFKMVWLCKMKTN